MKTCRNCGKPVIADSELNKPDPYSTDTFPVYVHADDEMYSCHGAFHPMNITYAEIEGQPQFAISADGKVILK